MRTVKYAFNQADSVPLCSRCCGALLFRCLLSMQYANTFKSIVRWTAYNEMPPQNFPQLKGTSHPSYPRATHIQWHMDKDIQMSSNFASSQGNSEGPFHHQNNPGLQVKDLCYNGITFQILPLLSSASFIPSRITKSILQ